MAVATKLGVALLVALASNATLLSMLLTQKTPKTTTTTTTADAPTTTNYLDDSDVPHDSEKGRKLSQELKQRGGGNVVEGYDQEAEHDPASVLGNAFSRRRGGVFPTRVNERGGKADARGAGPGEEEEEGEEEEVPPRSERSTLTRVDTGHHLNDVIASLTDNELEELDPGTAKVIRRCNCVCVCVCVCVLFVTTYFLAPFKSCAVMYACVHLRLLLVVIAFIQHYSLLF